MTERHEQPGLSPIVQTIAALIFPFILIFSFYVIMHGHLTPGGGFQGGAIGASAIVMLIVAYGASRAEKHASESVLSMLESLGGLTFVVVGLLGLVLVTDTLLANFLADTSLIFGELPSFGGNPGILNSGGTLPVLNLAVGMKVIGGLAAVVLAMAMASSEKEEEGDQ